MGGPIAGEQRRSSSGESRLQIQHQDKEDDEEHVNICNRSPRCLRREEALDAQQESAVVRPRCELFRDFRIRRETFEYRFQLSLLSALTK